MTRQPQRSRSPSIEIITPSAPPAAPIARSAPITPTAQPTYSQLLLHTLHPSHRTSLRISDVYSLSTVRHVDSWTDGELFVVPGTQWPVRKVVLVGWVSAVAWNQVDRDRTKQGGDMRLSITLDDGDGVNTITVLKTFRAKLIHPSHDSTSTRPRMDHRTSTSTSTSATSASSVRTLSATWTSTRPSHSARPTTTPSTSRKYVTNKERMSVQGRSVATVVDEDDHFGKQFGFESAEMPIKSRNSGRHAHQTNSDNSNANIHTNGYPSVPGRAGPTTYPHDRRYIPHSLRSTAGATTSHAAAAPPEISSSRWTYDYPSYAVVGSVVRVVGRVKEWRRRTGAWVREVEVVDNDGGVIELVTPAEEHVHLEEVKRAKETVYCRPIELGGGNVIAASAPTTPSKRTREEDGEVRSSPTCSVVSVGSRTCSVTDSPTRLRHPSKLRSAHLTIERFKHYVTAYISGTGIGCWTRLDDEVGGVDGALARYLPELMPKGGLAVGNGADKRNAKENVDPLRERLMTPRAAKRRAHLEGEDNAMTTPTPSELFRHNRRDAETTTAPTSTSTGIITLEELQYVPHLRLFARRMWDIEEKRQERRRRRDPAYVPAEDAAARRARRQGRRRKMRRLFRDALIELSNSGWLIEVDLADGDMARNRQAWEMRKRRRAGTGMGTVADVSMTSTLADSTVGSTFVSMMNASAASLSGVLADEAEDDGSSSDSDENFDPLDRANKVADHVGYLPVIQPILGRAILHIFNLEHLARGRRFLPKNDHRRTNGLDGCTIARRLKQLAQRWERVGEGVVQEGLQTLVDEGQVKQWGQGWWPVDLMPS